MRVNKIFFHTESVVRNRRTKRARFVRQFQALAFLLGQYKARPGLFVMRDQAENMSGAVGFGRPNVFQPIGERLRSRLIAGIWLWLAALAVGILTVVRVIPWAPPLPFPFAVPGQPELTLELEKPLFLSNEAPVIRLTTRQIVGSPADLDVLSVELMNERQEAAAANFLFQPDNHGAALTLDQLNGAQPGRYTATVRAVVNGVPTSLTTRFLWGVVAVNVRNAEVQPGQLQNIELAVLDNYGRTECNTDVTVQVRDPLGRTERFSTRGRSIVRNPACRDRSVTNDPDYQLFYATTVPGQYRITVAARTKDGIRRATDSFVASTRPEASIERTAYPTRIYPPATYPVHFSVMSPADFRGVVSEAVPKDFSVTDVTAGGRIREAEGKQYIEWDAEWQVGQRRSFGYTFKAPDISPELYRLGPIEIRDESGIVVASERREWQIAADATKTWDGGAADANWSSCDNWDNNTCPANTGDAIVFNGTSNDNSDWDAGSSVTAVASITASSMSGSLTFTKTPVSMTGNFSHTSTGNVIFAGSVSLTVTGTFTLTTSGTFTANSSTLKMDGLSKTINTAKSFYNLNIDPSSASTISIATNNPIVTNDLTVATGDTLSLGIARTLTLTGTSFNVSGTISGNGFLVFTGTSNGPGTGGTISATVRYDATDGDIGSGVVDARANYARIQFASSSSSNRTITMASGTYTTTTYIQVNPNGTGNLTVDASNGGASNPTVNIGGDLNFQGGGSGVGEIITGTGVWTVAGDAYIGAGTFTATSGNTLTLTGTAKSLWCNGYSIYNLTIDPASSGTITSEEDCTVTNVLTLGGAADGNNDTLTIVTGASLILSRTGTTSFTHNNSGTDTINGPGRLSYASSTTFPTTAALASALILRYDITTNNMTSAVRTDYGTIEVYNSGASNTTLTIGNGTHTLSGDMVVQAESTGSATVANTNNATINIAGSLGPCTGAGAGSKDISFGTSTWTVTTNLDFTSCGTITPSTSTILMNGTGGKVITGNSKTITSLTIDPSSTATIYLSTSDLVVTGTLTVAAGDTLSLDSGRTLSHTGATLTWGDASSTITGSGTLRFTSASGGPGTGGILSSVVRYDATASSIGSTIADARTYGGAVEFFSNRNLIRNISLPSGTFNFSSNVTVMTGASQSDTFTLSATASPTINITGNLAYSQGGAGTLVIASGTGVWTISGNVDFSSGTYTATSGNELIMDGNGKNLIGNGNSLYKLTINGNGNTITATGSDVTVSNILTIGAAADGNNDTLLIDTGRIVTSGAAGTVTLVGSGTDSITANGTGTLRVQNSNLGTGGTISAKVQFYDADVTMPARTYGGDVEAMADGTTRTVTMASGTHAITGNLEVNASAAGNVALTGAASGTVNLTGNLDFTGVGAGTESLTMGTSSTWTVTGNVNFTDGTVTATGSTLKMNGTTKTITPAAQSLANFEVSGGAIANVGALDVNGTFSVTSGGFTASGTVNLNVAGNVTLSNGTTFTGPGGGGKLILDGDLTLTDSTDTKQDLGDLEIGTSPDTTNLASDIAPKSLTVNSGDILYTNGYDIVTAGVTINGTLDATDDLEPDETLISCAANFTINSTATFVQDQSTVLMNGSTGTKTLITDGSFSLYNLTLNDGGNSLTVQVQDPLDVNNDLTITGGTLDAVSGEDNQITVGGSWDNDDTFQAQSGTVLFDAGSGIETIDADGTGTDSFNHVQFNDADGGATWQMTTSMDVNGNFTVTSGTFDFNGSNTLNIGGNYTNKDTIDTDTGTVIMDGATGTKIIDQSEAVSSAGSDFNALSFNDGGGSATYTTKYPLDVNGNLTIDGGNLDMTGPTTFYLTSDWDNGYDANARLKLADPAGSADDTSFCSDAGSGNDGYCRNLPFQENQTFLESIPTTIADSGWMLNNGIPMNGTFASGTWTADLTSVLTIGTCEYRSYGIAARLWKVTADLASATAISSWEEISTPAGVQDHTLTFQNVGEDLPEQTFNNEILFIELATYYEGPPNCGAGSTPTTMALRVNQGGTKQQIDSPAFTPSINAAGNWDNNDTFTHENGRVIFDAGATGKTIEAGASSFYDVDVNNASGGWTVQTNDMDVDRNLTLTAGAAWTVASGRTLEVNGNYTQTIAGANTTWTGSTLYLNGSGGMYDIKTKTHGGDTYATLRVGASEDIADWDSSAAAYTIDSGGCLFSEDHAGTSGRLNIYGTCNSRANEYWSYATDFDGAALGGSARQADVRFASSAALTVDSGDTLAILGQNAGANRTAVSRQAAGNYGLTVGGTINARYYDFDYLDVSGLNIASTATVSELSHGSFDNAGAGASSSYITITNATSDKIFFTNVFDDNADGADAAVVYNVNADGSGIHWLFDEYFGNKGGEDYDREVNGAIVDWGPPVLTMTLSTNLVDLGVLNPLVVGTGSNTITVTTTAEYGYTCSAIDDGNLRNGLNDIDDVTGGTITAGVEEYGITCSGADCQLTDYQALFGSPLEVAASAGPVTGSVTTITYAAGVDAITANGNYSHVVTYTCAGDF